MALRPELMNSFHDAHGGVVMALADVALAVAAITQDGAARGAITVDLSVSFLGPGKGTLLAEARCLRAGRSLAFSEGEIRDAEGSLVAKALGTFKLRR
ncbi:MAG: thioesterase superfamily protein [Anaeromyxobacteraceae bacterium]|nr:thioesterase superfamily protein [Anaeromyxobacteraceae bacterium]